jgi:hypothetical protein
VRFVRTTLCCNVEPCSRMRCSPSSGVKLCTSFQYPHPLCRIAHGSRKVAPMQLSVKNSAPAQTRNSACTTIPQQPLQRMHVDICKTCYIVCIATQSSHCCPIHFWFFAQFLKRSNTGVSFWQCCGARISGGCRIEALGVRGGMQK